MRRSPSSAAGVVVAVAACGPPHEFHRAAEDRCAASTITAHDDVVRLAGCVRTGALKIRAAGPVALDGLGRLETIDGDFTIGPTVGFSELVLPRVRELRGKLRVVASTDLRRVRLPALTTVDRIEIEGNVELREVALPKLAAASAIAISHSPELSIIDLSSLITVGELVITDNPSLVMVEVADDFRAAAARVEHNPMLPEAVTSKLAQ